MTERVIRIPIEITIRVGNPQTGAPGATVTTAEPADASAGEEMVIDENYDHRKGFDENFLGRNAKVEMPTLTKSALELVSVPDGSDEDEYLLHYYHYSLSMNKKRRLLFFAASNTTRNPDLFGKQSRVALGDGQGEKWILDPRIPPAHQATTRELYTKIHFDRGHIVRREDSYWGETPLLAKYANFDTFHYTNCTPQAPDYNRSNKQGIWGLLENYIAKQAGEQEVKLSLIAGPVLNDRDPILKDTEVRVPRSFWKIVLGRIKGGDSSLGAWAFLLSQAKQVKDAREGVFDPGEFGVYQVPISQIEELTEVRFSDQIKAADQAGNQEGVGWRPIEDVSQIKGAWG